MDRPSTFPRHIHVVWIQSRAGVLDCLSTGHCETLVTIECYDCDDVQLENQYHDDAPAFQDGLSSLGYNAR